MKFFHHFKNGISIKKENELNYNWPGLLNIDNYLNSTSNAIEIINNKTQIIFSRHQRILKENKKLKEIIEDLPNIGYVSFKNINEENKTKIYPIYTKQFEDLENRNLTLGKIYYDYKINFEQNSNILNELYKELSNVSINKEDFIFDINNTIINLNNFSILFLNMSETFSENYGIYFK